MKKIFEKVLNLYQDDFVYIDSSTLLFSKERGLIGNIIRRRAAYFRDSQCAIFNNTEAMIAFNQAAYISSICTLMGEHEASCENENDIFKEIYKSVGNMVIMKQTFNFKSMLTQSDSIPFCFKLKLLKKRNETRLAKLHLTLGDNDEFIINAVGAFLSKDVHWAHTAIAKEA